MSDKSLEKVDFDGVTDEFPEIESVLNSLTP